MGTFDTLQCEMDLPEGAKAIAEWQTKDLECALMTYAIRPDGRLVDARIRMEPKPGTPPAPKLLTRAYSDWHNAWYERKEGPDQPVSFTGLITFYAMAADKTWWEFCALVEQGRCLRIDQIEPEAPSSGS